MTEVMLKFLAVLSFAALVSCNDDLLVETNNGLLRGKYMDIQSGKSIRAYLGIPFAEAPIGELRFKDPVPIENWEGIKDATEEHPLCPQINSLAGKTEVEGVEDCLFMNVYIPKNIGSELLPVMVFIHGGAFYIGSGNTHFYGPDILLDKGNVILVTMNYRLGALGFATTDDEIVHGNMGLKDQALSMKWVKENIEKFGGDSNKITIFGESAGGASVHLQTMSPISKGLYHAAISQSGTALCNWAAQSSKEGAEFTTKLAGYLGCPTGCTKKMIECMRGKDVNEIMQKQTMLFEWGIDPVVVFRPVVEHKHAGAFIYKHPREIIRAGGVHDVPWMTGVNTGEGLLRLPSLLLNPNAIKEFDNDFERIAYLTMFTKSQIPEGSNVINKIRDFYLNGKTMQESDLQSIVDMYSDAWFISGADEAVNMLRKYTKQPVYYYLFGYQGSASIMDTMGSQIKGDLGVCHADELQFLFIVGDFMSKDLKRNEMDNKVTDIMTTLWTNFATYGKPTPNPAQGEVEWKPIQSDGVEYFYIGDQLKMKKGMFEKRVEFWRNLQNDIQKGHDEL